MKYTKNKKVSLFILVMLMVISCQMQSVPTWYRKVPQDDRFIYAASTATSRDPQLAIQRAQFEGRVKIASRIEDMYKAIEVGLLEDVNPESAGELKAIIRQLLIDFQDRELKNSNVVDRQINRDDLHYTAYVLQQFPISVLDGRLYTMLRNKDVLYENIKNNSAFTALEKRVQNHHKIE